MIYDKWIFYLLFILLFPFRGLLEARRVAGSSHEMARNRALPRLAAALVEFQKAQCYFMIAVQIAAITSISRGRLQPKSLQQLYNNWQAVRGISVGGFLPVTFILLSLQSVGKRSWYLTLLSTITIFVSAASLAITGAFSLRTEDLIFLRTQTNDIRACGNHDPTTYCLDLPADSALGDNSRFTVLGFSLCVLGLIYADLLRARLYSIHQRQKSKFQNNSNIATVGSYLAHATLAIGHLYGMIEKMLQTNGRFGLPSRPPWLCSLSKVSGRSYTYVKKKWRNLAIELLLLTVWVLYILFFTIFMTSLRVFLSSGLVNFDWSFGQIVGITVWAEPLVEYFYLETSESLCILDYVTPSSSTSG